MTPIPLATVADPTQVERVRELVADRACVVIGSAPLSTAHVEVCQDEFVVAVNGGISSVSRDVDLWVVGSKTWDKPDRWNSWPLHQEMLRQATGRVVPYALFLRGPKESTEGYTLDRLRELKCTVAQWSVCDKPTKLWLECELCGRVEAEKKPCSSGILTVAIALYCGASVRMAGFSLLPGYNYINNPRPTSRRDLRPPSKRDHVEADKRALVALLDRYGDRLSGECVRTAVAA